MEAMKLEIEYTLTLISVTAINVGFGPEMTVARSGLEPECCMVGYFKQLLLLFKKKIYPELQLIICVYDFSLPTLYYIVVSFFSVRSPVTSYFS